MSNRNMKGMLMILVSAVTLFLIASAFSGVHGNSQIEENMITEENSLTSTDGSKTKTMYLHNETGTVNENVDVMTMNTTMGEDQHITDFEYSSTITHDWYLNPPFAGEFTLNGTSTINMWIDIAEADGHTNTIDLTMSLYEVQPDGAEDFIDQGFVSYDNTRTIFNEYSVSTDISGYTISPESSLRVEFVIESSDNFVKRVAFGDSEYPSRIEVETEDYIDVDTFTILDSEFEESYDFRLGADETTIHFNTSITNPFGGYDISRVNLTVEGPDGTVFYREPMTRVTGNDSSYRSNFTYEWDYGGQAEGEYTAIVSAVDNTGYNYRYPDNPGDETYGGHLESVEKDFWIGAERFFIHFQTVDSMDIVLEDAEVVAYSSDLEESITSNVTNDEGVTNISITEGEYIFRVYWEDVLVNETTYQVSDNVPYEDAITLNCSVYDTSYKVVDVAGEPVPNANIFISHPNSTLIREITDTDGYVHLPQSPVGDYSLRTEWLGREVDSTEHYLNESVELTIYTDVYYLNIHTMDTEEVPVPEVHVSIRFNDTRRIADSKLTDINGNLTVRLPGTGGDFTYDLNFQWRGVEVKELYSEPFEGNRSLDVELEIYYVELQTLDDLGYELENTRLVARNLETDTIANTGNTDQAGRLVMRLPRGPHRIISTWRGIEVDVTDVDITGTDQSIELECSVYHVELFTIDSRDEIISDARITVSHHTAGTLTSGTTGENGNVSMRLPGAVLNMQVQWKGAEIYNGDMVIDSSEDYEIQCAVYYLDMNIVDDQGEPLENARVEFYLGNSLIEQDTSLTDGSVPEMRLPGVELDISISWRNVDVYQDEINLNEDLSMTAITDVYHIDFLVQDDFDVPVGGGRLRVSHGDTLLHTELTSEDGRSFSRIPGATNQVTLQWNGVMVYDSPVVFDASEEMVIHVEDIYHVSFQIVDSRGNPLNNARASFDTEGTNFDSSVTGENGTVNIRVPTPVGEAGEISILVEWRGVVVYNDDMTVNEHILSESPETIDAEVYYVDFYIIDERDIPVENSKVIVRHSELPSDRNIISDRISDTEGHIQFLLPRGEQTFTVHWKNVVVHTQTEQLSEDIDITADSDIYYLTLSVRDERGLPLSSAPVRVTYEDSPKHYYSGYTDGQGEVEIRIPAENWDIEVEWLNTVVHQSQHEVTAEEESWSLDIDSDVYYLTVTTLDRNEEHLDDVHLKVSTENQVWTGYTTDGKYEFRLPARDDYNVNASFRTTYLLTDVDIYEDQDIVLVDTAEESVDFEEYPTPIYRTNLFFLILIIILLLAILYTVYSKIGSGYTDTTEEDIYDDEEYLSEEDEFYEEQIENGEITEEQSGTDTEEDDVWE